MWAASSPSTIHQSLLASSTWYPGKLVKDPMHSSQQSSKTCHIHEIKEMLRRIGNPASAETCPTICLPQQCKPQVAKRIQNKIARPTRRLDTRLRGWHEDRNGQQGALLHCIAGWKSARDVLKYARVSDIDLHGWWHLRDEGQVGVRRLAAKTFNS